MYENKLFIGSKIKYLIAYVVKDNEMFKYNVI